MISSEQSNDFDINLRLLVKGVRLRFCDQNEELRHPFQDFSMQFTHSNSEKLWHLIWNIMLNRLFEWRRSLQIPIVSAKSRLNPEGCTFVKTLMESRLNRQEKVPGCDELELMSKMILCQTEQDIPESFKSSNARADCYKFIRELINPDFLSQVQVSLEDKQIQKHTMYRQIWLNYLSEKLFHNTALYLPHSINEILKLDLNGSRETENYLKMLLIGMDQPLNSDLKLVRQQPSSSHRLQLMIKALQNVKTHNDIVEVEFDQAVDYTKRFQNTKIFKMARENTRKIQLAQIELAQLVSQHCDEYSERRVSKLRQALERLKQDPRSALGTYLNQRKEPLTRSVVFKAERYLTLKRTLESIIELERKQIANSIQWVSLHPAPKIGFSQTVFDVTLKLPLEAICALSELRDYSLFGIYSIKLKPKEQEFLFSNCIEIDQGVVEDPDFELKEEHRSNQDPLKFTNHLVKVNNWGKEYKSKHYELKTGVSMCHQCKALLPHEHLKICQKVSKRNKFSNCLWNHLRRRLMGIEVNDRYICAKAYCRWCLEKWYSYDYSLMANLKSKPGYACPYCLQSCCCSSCIRAANLRKQYVAFQGYGGSLEQLLRLSPTSIMASHILRIPDALSPRVKESHKPVPDRPIAQYPDPIVALPNFLEDTDISAPMYRQSVSSFDALDYFSECPEPEGPLYPLCVGADVDLTAESVAPCATAELSSEQKPVEATEGMESGGLGTETASSYGSLSMAGSRGPASVWEAKAVEDHSRPGQSPFASPLTLPSHRPKHTRTPSTIQ